MNLLTRIRSLFEPVLKELAPDKAKVPELLSAIKTASNPEHGDYQANMAMALGKAMGVKPQDAARTIVERLPANDMLERPVIAGPGFINLRLTPAFLAKSLREIAIDPRLGVEPVARARTYVIDLSGPNVAKPLHVGHLRSTIIGDALVRLLRFLGHKVISDNHLGDWGTQFGMLIYGYRNFLDKKKYAGSNEDKVRELARIYVLVRNLAGTIDILSRGFTHFRDEAAFRDNPVAELTRVYVNGLKRAAEADDDDEEGGAKGPPAPNPVADSYRQETAKLHAGDAENLKLWKEFMPPCMEEIHKVYRKLEILPIDHEYGESHYQPMLGRVVESLVKAGLAEPGEGGSLIIRDPKGNVSMLRKRDGAFTYTTTDLATVRYRMEEFKPDVMLYVVDFRQEQHFATLFDTARRWGFASVEFSHVKFGSVLGKDGKPIKTREGGAVELTHLLDRAIELGGNLFELTYWQRKANGHEVPKWEEFTEDEKERIAAAVGIGAVKYADLSQSRTTDYKFDYAKMLATNGNTGTYMQYAYARCRAIFRKGEIDETRFASSPPSVRLDQPAERALAIQLLRFPEVIEAAAADYLPHLLTAYLWDLAKGFSTFFENCPVLKAETPELRDSRLLLVDLVARTIKQALDLLGIRTIERM